MTAKKNDLFDDLFIKQNMMGPSAIRIIEEISKEIMITKGMRVLDLGCGKGLSSIYLAKNYDITLYATDLWISATENYERFKAVMLDQKIVPIHADARNLPFANGYFDLVISIDAYHYFGCEEGYLSTYLAPLIKRNGEIVIAVPGLKREFTNGVPEELKPFWQEDMNLHSCTWWENLWKKEKIVKITKCHELHCFKEAWDDWLSCDNDYARRDREMMKAENGNYFNIVAISGRIL